jgi:TonB family protein
VKDIVPPEPLMRPAPDMRMLEPGLINGPVHVRVQVNINADGHVTAAHLVAGGQKIRPTLAGAAVTAAKQWTFRPATMHGQRVPSEHVIDFEFSAK